jgi:hypothetical protein
MLPCYQPVCELALDSQRSASLQRGLRASKKKQQHVRNRAS